MLRYLNQQSEIKTIPIRLWAQTSFIMCVKMKNPNVKITPMPIEPYPFPVCGNRTSIKMVKQ
jgi:hypothetical protein